MRYCDIQNVNMPFWRHVIFLWDWPSISRCQVIPTASDGRAIGKCSGAGVVGSGPLVFGFRGCPTQTPLALWGQTNTELTQDIKIFFDTDFAVFSRAKSVHPIRTNMGHHPHHMPKMNKEHRRI